MVLDRGVRGRRIGKIQNSSVSELQNLAISALYASTAITNQTCNLKLLLINLRWVNQLLQ